MAAHRHLAIIAYDIPSNRVRTKLSSLLEGWLTRVQDSVFEGWLTRRQAHALMARAAEIAGIDGSVRLYLVPRGAVAACATHGFPPKADDDGLLIL
ncbi:MAG: CRISPR-associated endonuclease Cas2 [Pseudomonadota bacterium]|jgi:CRISPR-associated endonuclease Cas2